MAALTQSTAFAPHQTMTPEKACQLLIFGDLNSHFENNLLALLHIKDNESLRSFIEQVNYALRVEISELSLVERGQFPRFTTLIDLFAKYKVSKKMPALNLALLCVTQLGQFINYYGRGHRQYPNASNSFVTGPCAGSFAASAISVAQSLSELLPAAVEAVLVAFRTGLCSMMARDAVDSEGEDSLASWSVAVGVNEELASTALEEFVSKKGLARSSQPYISAVAGSNVTISGPPSVLTDLIQSHLFRTAKSTGLRIHAPYHASHLYGSSDIEAIMARIDKQMLRSYRVKIPLISAATGKTVDAKDYEELLRTVLEDILMRKVRWDYVLKNSSTELTRETNYSQCTIFPVLTNAEQSLASELSQTSEMDITINAAIMNDQRAFYTSRQTGKFDQSKIAIVGYSGRFPDAANTDKFWDLLHQGLDVHKRIPKDRFDVDAHYDPTGKRKNTSKVQHGCFIEEPGLFDGRFFHMSPRECENTDPAQRLAITTAYEALEMSGFVPDRTPSTQRDRVGVFYGLTSDDWREVNSSQNIDTYFVPGGCRAFVPGRINYFFKFSGPSISVDTACSSSSAAIHVACNALWRGDCDTAIGGGANVLTNPDNWAGLDRGHFLSSTGNCNTFDDAANGYCRADGVGSVILKRLEDAEADHDPIYGVILGAYTNHSGQTDSITRPHDGDQAAIFGGLLRNANVNPLDVSYIEMHGTGTQAGDATEMKSVLNVFSPGYRGDQHPLHLGSAKANVGHAEGASGVTSLIKLLMMMKYNEIPPHCGIKTKINHGFPLDLEARNVHIALKPTPWMRQADKGRKRTAFLNNFSAAGGNSSLLVQDAEELKLKDIPLDTRSTHVVAVSAKSLVSLQMAIKSLVTYISTLPETSLGALSYTTTARRQHYNYRAIVSGRSLSEIEAALSKSEPCINVKAINSGKASKIGFVFTGQGTVYTGLARQIYELNPQFRAELERYNGIAQNQGFESFLPLVDGSVSNVDDLDNIILQMGVTCVQIALAHLWMQWGVSPSFVIGHSLGEYAAMCIAGVISASDAIFLVGRRAQILSNKCSLGTHAMLAIKESETYIRRNITGTSCEIACLNQPSGNVISGPKEEIEELAASFKSRRVECIQLQVPYAFHSSQIEPMLEQFESSAQAVSFSKPRIPFVSPLLQEVVCENGLLGPSYVARASRGVVNFEGAINAACHQGIADKDTNWVEIGAHPTCSGMLKGIFGIQVSTHATLRQNIDTWKVLTESLQSLHMAGVELLWDEYHRAFPASHQVLELPRYSWDLKHYWIQYRHNHCLTKGDPPAVQIESAPLPIVSSLSTPSIQRVLDQNLGANISTLVVESDLHNPLLEKVIRGHKVNGAALCPSSLYADIALTIGDYLIRNNHNIDTSLLGMDVSEMIVEKPLIMLATGPQILRASATANWTNFDIAINMYSVNAEGKKTMDHAACTIRLSEKNSWTNEWKRNTYLIAGRIKSLQQDVDIGESHKMKRGMVYKLFGALVDYSKDYQGMSEVVLNSQGLEATARVSFQSPSSGYFLSPHWIDSLGHIAGFVMNSNDIVDPKVQVFINHGWERMRYVTEFSPEKTYRSYVKMQPVGGNAFVGNTYIFDGEEVVALFEGVKFQGVPRQVLDTLLPKKSAITSNLPTTKPQPTPAPVQRFPPKKLTPILAPPPIAHAKSTVVDEVLAVIADEAGLSLSEIGLDNEFADLGIDSLMSLTITGKLREELGVDFSSTLFSECPTVDSLIQRLGGRPEPLSDSSDMRRSTPVDETLSESTLSDVPTQSTSVAEEQDIISTIRLTVAEELGLPIEEITPFVELSSLGMDSLLALTVLGRLREQIYIDIPVDIFAHNNTLDEVESVLAPKSKPVTQTPQTFHTPAAKQIVTPKATSILLQGNPKTASKTLFLFPDGSGSATSYAALPALSSSVAIYGLNCPYMKTPESFKCSIEDLCCIYIEELLRRQPRGPYHLGGWSAGGICAYEAAQQLSASGHTIAELVLIDSPNPVGIQNPPLRLYDFFASLGLVGSEGREPPSWLRPHFQAFMTALDRYEAAPFHGGSLNTIIVWARDGVCKSPDGPQLPTTDADPKEMRWLLNNRTDFTSNGWDALLGGGSLHIETISGVNHFSMLAPQNVQGLGDILREALTSSW